MIINYIITRISRTRSKGTRTNLEIASLKEVIKSLAMHRAAFISFGRNSLVTAEGEVFFPRFKSGTTVFPGSRVKSVRRRRENIKERCGTTVGIRSETAVGIFQLFSSGRRTCRDLGRGVETFSAKSSIGKKGKQEGGGEKVTRGNYPRKVTREREEEGEGDPSTPVNRGWFELLITRYLRNDPWKEGRKKERNGGKESKRGE